MPHTFTPEDRAQHVRVLTEALNRTTIQTLRLAARQWGWPLKGVAKAELVEQMLGDLGDVSRMGAAIETLPGEERDTLIWLNALNLAGDPVKPLQAALAQSSGRQMTQKAIGQVVQKLMERGLLFDNENQRYSVPKLFAEWLPPAGAPKLLHEGEPSHVPPFTLVELNQHIQHLLSAVEVDRPEMVAATQAAASIYMAARPGTESVTPRPGLVAAEVLNRWGYSSADERHLARFLLEQMTAGGLCKVVAHNQGRRLEVAPPALRDWEELTPAERLGRLRQWWLPDLRLGSQPGMASTWNELDLALNHIKGYTLRPVGYWATADQWTRQVAFLRAWLLGLATALQPDTWYSVERFGNLIYQIRRDLLNWEVGLTTWRWHQDKTPLDPNQMNIEVWRATYGRLIEAWLLGPATWLAFIQVGYAGGQPIAFRHLSQAPTGDLAALPTDALRFPLAEIAVLRNTWQTGELRQLLRRVAVETARDRDVTTYRLNISAFRQALRDGLDAGQIAAGFAAAGAPLPAATQDQLRSWQEKAGRHQLYDNLAVIEFGDDIHPQEVKAIAGLGGVQFYPVSPRCLVVLNPDAVPAFVDELRRRGYTPQVLS